MTFMQFWKALNEILWEMGEDEVLFADARHLAELFDDPRNAAEHEAFVRHN
jgi:hypothetical protein